MSPKTQDIATVGHAAGQFAEYLAEGHNLCRQIAALDLAGHPLYIVPQSRIADAFGKAEACYAYTTPSLDLYLREYIDNWSGRGPCMVVNDLAIEEDQDPEFHSELVRNHIIHELAHILDRPQPVIHRSLKPARIKFESLVVAKATNEEPAAAPIFGHGLSFIRIATHLIERANRAGYDVRHSGVIRWHRCGLPPIDQYIDAVQLEVEKYLHMRFREFPEPSSQLLRLFQSDVHSQGGTHERTVIF